MTTRAGMQLLWTLFKKEIVDLSGSKGRIKNNNGLDVTVEKLLRGNQKVVMEEEIARNVKKEEEVATTHQEQDNGVLVIL